jgi:hypothetical protein
MQLTESRDYLDITAHSIMAFASNGRLDLHGFNKLVEIALRDDYVDENEKRVLGNIIRRLTPAELTPELSERIQKVRATYCF